MNEPFIFPYFSLVTTRFSPQSSRLEIFWFTPYRSTSSHFQIMPLRMKMSASKGGSSSDPPCNPGKRSVTQSLPRKRSKKLDVSYSLGRDAMSLEHYNWIFSHCSIITDQSVNAKTLRMAQLTERLEGWCCMSFILVFRPVQEEAVRVFYVNMFEISNKDLSFWTVVCNTPVQVSPTILSTIFDVPRPSMSIPYPIYRLTMEQKGCMV